jgi:hypothetical protein
VAESRAFFSTPRLVALLAAISILGPLGIVGVRSASPPWRAEYFANPRFDGPRRVTTELDVRHQWRFMPSERRILPSNEFSARWSSCLRLSEAVHAYWSLSHRGIAELRIDGAAVIPMSTDFTALPTRGTQVELSAGTHLVEVRFAGDALQDWIALDASLDGRLPRGLPKGMLELPDERGACQ